MHNENCKAQHIGPWMIEPLWFSQAFRAVQDGTWQAVDGGDSQREKAYTMADNGIAVVPLHGQLMKGHSKYGGTSSVAARQAVRMLSDDPGVEAIMLHVDSPGGTAAGTAELADDIYAANKKKPVHAHAEDLMASAAAFAGMQARRVTVNRAGEVGSFGTVAVLTDTSGMAEAAGVKVHVVSTGPFKGSFAQGTPVTDEQLEYAGEMVQTMNEPFIEGVARGRKMPIAQARKLFFGAEGGKVFGSNRAMDLGIVDAVESFDDAMRKLSQEVRQIRAERRRQQQAASRRMEMKKLDLE